MSIVWWQTPKYEYRGNYKREMHFADGEKLCLTVDTSTIPNSGKGLFLTYLGNSNDDDDDDDDIDDDTNSNSNINNNSNNVKKWTPSQIVDLGVYSPHTESDIKPKHIMEVKFFLYDQYPSIYCFSGPDYKQEDYNYIRIEEEEEIERQKELNNNSNLVFKKRKPQQLLNVSCTKQHRTNNNNDRSRRNSYDNKISKRKGALLFGKQLCDVFYDVTCEKNGKLHEFAQSSLLPYANESTPEMMQRQKFKQGNNQSNNKINNSNDNNYLFAAQKPSLSAVFHPDGTLHYVLSPGIKTFYKNVTTELFVYYGKDYQGVRDRKTEYNSHSSTSNNINTSMHNSSIQSIVSSLQEDNQPYTFCTMCGNKFIPSLHNDITTSLDDDNLPNIGYTSIRKAVSTFNERQVIDILQYFLQYPPEPSDARRRMWWLTKEIRTYCLEFLYAEENGVPSHIAYLIEEALKLFPRNKTHKQDLDILTKNQYLGDGVRMRITNSTNNKPQWLHGYVEDIICRKCNDNDDDINNALICYKIVFVNGQHCYLNEDELLNYLFEGRYGFI